MQASKQVPFSNTALVDAGRPSVLLIGAANMDISGSTSHRLTPGDSTPGKVRCAAGGVARNVAENLARLAHGVYFLSAVGDDMHGRSLLESTRNAGVDVSGCWILGDQATSSYVSLHGPDGDMLAAVNDMSVLDHITPERLAPYAGRMADAAALMLDCNLSEAALAWLFAHARDKPVFVDVVSAFKCRRILPWLSRVHTLKANRIEAEALWGQPVRTDTALESAARWLHAQGVGHVVLSLGERGVSWSANGGDKGWQTAVPISVVNSTGAGDALMAGLLHQHLCGSSLEQALPFALACAAMTLTTTQANHAELSVAAVRKLCNSGNPHASKPLSRHSS